jgi:hypothetical protein
MLDDKTIGTGPATIPWFAARDANMRSEAAKGLFSPAAHLKAERMRMALSTCYKGDKFHITWRDGGKAHRPKFAAVKVENPRLLDRKNLKSLEALWDQEAIAGTLLKRITKRTTQQGITYRAYF